jgi:uncharacterized protein
MTTTKRYHGCAQRAPIIAALLVSLCAATPVSAQQDASAGIPPDSLQMHDPGFTKIMLTARVDKDSVVLRWAPATAHGWRVANRTGYVVERRSGTGAFIRLTPDTLHPRMAHDFIDAMRERPDDRYLGLVLNALWGDSVLISPDGVDTVGENATRNTTLFGYALFAADNDPSIADAMGLRFVDRNVRTGDRFTYRISLNEPRDYRIDPGEVEVEVRPASANPPPVNLSARGLDGRIELRWDPQPSIEYTGYIVTRSSDGGKKFTQMNATPIVIVAAADTAMHPRGGFTDTSVVNYKPYVYRVSGITAFGERGIAAEVKATARDLTPPPAPLMKQPQQTGRGTVRLGWDVPPTGRDLAGFVVLRSAVSDSNFRALTRKPLPAKIREYTDARADDAEPYYIVASVDTAGNQAASFPVFCGIIDTMPPAVPTGLRGTIDSAGIVRLTWNRNRERAVVGYRVLRANAPDHEYTQLTGQAWPDTSFTDTVTVRTLTRHVYYRIAAVNARFNHSRLSPAIALRRPDDIPPEAPAIYDVQASDSSVALRWAPSSSTDVASHLLSRRTMPGEAWVLIATLARTASQYTDMAVQPNTTYEYRIEAADSSGLRSTPGLTVQARPFDTGVRAPATGLTATHDQKANTITLQWFASASSTEKMYVVVFRSKNNGPLLRYRSVDGSERMFVDREIGGAGTYEYAVKIITESGAESPLSSSASVNLRATGK